MDYSGLLTRAWQMIWNHKFLIGLGMLAALGSGGGGNGRGGSNTSNGPQPGGGGGQFSDFCERGFGPLFRDIGIEGTTIIVAIVLVVLGIALVGFLVWAISRVAEGGLISGVNEIESGRASGFSMAWGAGWAKGWQLVGIGLVTAVPGILLLVILGALFYQFFAGENWRMLCVAASSTDPDRFVAAFRQTSSLWIVVVSVGCLFSLGTSVLQAIREFADRACMTENTGILESYGRGWAVMSANLGQVVLLFLIQIAVGLAVGVLMIVPGIVMAACFCVFWPLAWAISGTVKAYFSTLWTLAWREWVGAGKAPGEPVSPAPAPLG